MEVAAQMVQRMKALVTGANGFVGSHLAEELVRKGWEVTCLVRRLHGLGWIENLDVRLVKGDCRDKGSLGPAVEAADYVFHLAGVINALKWRTTTRPMSSAHGIS
jgi:nucleoside-diphosphate-sugar epimerase